MRKITTLFPILLFVTALKAQHSGFNAVPVQHFKGVSPSRASNKPNAACDTVNLDAANNWQAYYYTYGHKGYVFGVSNNDDFGFNILEDANFFDVSAGGYNYISGGLVYFAKANSDSAAELDKKILFNVYDDTIVNSTHSPNNLLGSTFVYLRRIHKDVLDGNLTEFLFSSPIAIPASKTFYISIDHHNFRWNGQVHDSIAIVANGSGDTTAAAYQFLNVFGTAQGWIPVNNLWVGNSGPLEVNLFVFPYVSTSADGCGLLPVTMFNFGGSIKDNAAYLNWSTATENNNKGFYIERSKDAQNFSSIGFVNGAGNSSKITNYTYTDYLIKDLNVTTTYYRLKQVDLDGKYSYSKVLPLNMKNLFQYRLYPNPVKDVATVELSLESASKVNVQVISHDGKIVLNSDKGVMIQGTQQVFINTQNLAKGIYIAHITAGDKTYNIPFVKE
jgi:hypothetical protein